MEFYFSDEDDPFEDINFEDIFQEEGCRTLTIGGKKVRFKSALSDETRRLLLTTCSNLNFANFSPTKGLLMENRRLSSQNRETLFKTMGFDFMAKYLLFEHFLCTYSFGIKSWRVVLQAFHPKSGIKANMESPSNPSKTRRYQGFDENYNLVKSKYIMKCTKQVGDMLHGSLKKYSLTVGPDRGPILSDVQYPGNNLVQKARLKCCLSLNEIDKTNFCKQQLFADDNIFDVVDCLNDIITHLELDQIIEEPPPKKMKLEITVSKATQDIRQRPKVRFGKFQSQEVIEEYKEIISKRKEPVKFQPRVWMWTCLVGGVDHYIRQRLNLQSFMHTDYTFLFVSSFLCLMFGFVIITHSPRSNKDWIMYPILLITSTIFDWTDYVFARWIGIITNALTVWFMSYSWKIAWIPIAIGSILNWYLSWTSWLNFIKMPFIFVSYWNQHRRKQKNPASILLSPYRDWAILITVLLLTISCVPN